VKQINQMKNQTQATAMKGNDPEYRAMIQNIMDNPKPCVPPTVTISSSDHALLVAIKDAAELLTAKSDAISRESCWHNLKSALAAYEKGFTIQTNQNTYENNRNDSI